MSDSRQQRPLSPTRPNELAQFGSLNSSTNVSGLMTPGSPEPLAHPTAGGSSRLAALAEPIANPLGSQGGTATPPGGMGVTPPRARPKGKVLMLAPGANSARAGDVSPGHNILGVIKRELELLEAKIFAEVDQRTSSLQDAHERSDKIHDLALQRIEKKLSDHDEAIARMDKRVAEVHGQVRGLNDSTIQSSRWQASVDGNIEIFRNQVEDHFQRSASDLDASSKDLASKVKSVAAVSEESHAKLKESLRRVDAAVQEQAGNNEALAEAMAGEQERLRDVEAMATRGVVDLQDRLIALENNTKASAAQSKKVEGSLADRLGHLESQLLDQGQQVGRLLATANGESGWDSQLSQHETALTVMERRLVSFEDYSSRIDDAIRQRWGHQIEQLEKAGQEHLASRRDMEEKQELLVHQSRAQHDELMERLQELEHRSQGLRLVDMGDMGSPEEVAQDELPSGQITPVLFAQLGMRTGEGLRAGAGPAAYYSSPPSGAESPGEGADLNGGAEPLDDDGGLSQRVSELCLSIMEMVPSVNSTKDMVTHHGERLGDLARRLEAVEVSSQAAAGSRQDAGAVAAQQGQPAELGQPQAHGAQAQAQAQAHGPPSWAAPSSGAAVAQVAERLDRETRDRQQAMGLFEADVKAAISEVRAELLPKIQGVERSVKKVIEGNTNIVQTLTAHAGSSLPGVLASTPSSPLLEGGGADLDQLAMQCDASEAKILDAQAKLRARVNNFQYLLEAASTKANSPGTC